MFTLILFISRLDPEKCFSVTEKNLRDWAIQVWGPWLISLINLFKEDSLEVPLLSQVLKHAGGQEAT